jgi:H+/Cl- antiporter ClcA
LIYKTHIGKNNLGEDHHYNFFIRYACWILFHWICMMYCASVGEYISRDAEGSGVPEMKGVLAGVHLHNFLSVKAFIGKWTGIVVGLCGGLSFGRQGAFVHCSCIITH